MTPDYPTDPRQALEASLTALLLGELPPDQAAFLQQAIASDTELARTYERLKQTIELVREIEAKPAQQTAAQPEPLRLGEGRREQLLQRFKTIQPKELERARRWKVLLVELGAVAAGIAVLAAIFFPALNRSRGSRATWSSASAPPTLNFSPGSLTDFATESSNGRRVLRRAAEPAAPPASPTQPPQTSIVLPAMENSDSARVQTLSAISGSAGSSFYRAWAPNKEPLQVLTEGTPSAVPTASAGTSGDLAPLEVKLPAPAFGGTLKDMQLVTVPSGGGGFGGGAAIQPGTSTNAPNALGGGDLAQAAVPEAAFRSRYALSGETAGRAMQNGVETYLPKLAETAPAPSASAGITAGRFGIAAPMAPSSEGGVEPTTGLPVPLPETTHTPAALDTTTGLPIASFAPKEVPVMPPANTSGISPFDRYAVPSRMLQNRRQGGILSLGEPADVGRFEFQSQGGQPNLAEGKGEEEPTHGFDLSDNDVLARNRLVQAQGGTAPSLSGFAAGNAPGTLNTFGDNRSETVASGTLVMGDLPQLGVLFRSEPAQDKERSMSELAAAKGRREKIVLPSAQPESRSTGGIVLPPQESAVNEAITHQLDDNRVRRRLAEARKPEEQEKMTTGTLYADARDLAKKLATTTPAAAEKDKTVAAAPSGPTNVYQLNIVGYVNVPMGTNTATLETRQASVEGRQSEQSQVLFDAKKKLDEATRFRSLLYAKLEAGKTDLRQPRSSQIEIVDKATSTQSPAFWSRIGLGGGAESKARVRFERDQSDLQGLAQPRTSALYDPYFVQSEFETIQSEPVLGKVVDQLKLDELWAVKNRGGSKLNKAETIKLLKQRLDLKPVPNTSLVDIGVKGGNSKEAAQIANTIAEVYRDFRQEQHEQLAQSGLFTLKERFDEQEKAVAAAQREVDQLQQAAAGQQTVTNRQTDVAPPKPATPPPVPQPEIQTSDNPFSTFSLNVSDVSFKLAAATLEKGALPEPAGIRTEEFINAFDYRDPEPPAGVPVAFAWERVRYPFAQNRDLLRFSIKTAAAGRQAGRPLNIVLLLDNSGSMERADRVRIIQEALRVLAGQLQAQDIFSVVTFARTARLWVDGVPGNQAGKVAEELGQLTPQGGTNLGDAMDLAYQTALRHYLANGVNRVVLLTDGAANLGNVEPDALKQKVETNRKQGIALDCFGIGWEGYNDDLLEVLTRNGDGRYGFINTPEEAATGFASQLAGALQVAAADVKVQVEFNPNRVTAYRQLGYAKHQLTKEQFRDNTVDAAELGAAESGNALYVIEAREGGGGPLATVRVRYKVPDTGEFREQEWSVPYTGNAVPLDQASPAMRLAACASAFAEWLATSPYAAEVTPDSLLGYLGDVPGIYGADQRPKQLEWMLRQAKSIAGK